MPVPHSCFHLFLQISLSIASFLLCVVIAMWILWLICCIMQCQIWQSMSCCDLFVCSYASNQHLKTVCSTLVMTYPCLQAKVKVGQTTTRYVSIIRCMQWYFSILNRFGISFVKFFKIHFYFYIALVFRMFSEFISVSVKPKSFILFWVLLINRSLVVEEFLVPTPF